MLPSIPSSLEARARRRSVGWWLIVAVASCLSIGQRTASGATVSPDDPVARLIAQLGDDDYFVRERAQQQLARTGFEAFDALEAAQEDEDIEIASRAKYLVSQMQIEWTVATDSPEVKQLLQGYGQKDEAAHAAIVDKLNDLPDDKGLAVLCRLVRFDKSLVVSKLAALAIIKTQRIREQRRAREKVITDNLGHSPRPGASGCGPIWRRTRMRRRGPSGGANWPTKSSRRLRSSHSRLVRKLSALCGGSRSRPCESWTGATKRSRP